MEYLSPSSIQKWTDDREQFYLQYLAEDRPPREPQTQPMSIGSAFDAHAKNYLHDKLFGKNHKDSNRFDLRAIFEAQVERQHWDWAWINGKYCFEQYQKSGALTDLLLAMQGAKSDPRFEFEVRGQIQGYREPQKATLGTVVLLGKPDAYFINKDGHSVILDWKVSGYCSSWPNSPMKGYVALRQGDGKMLPCHKDASLHTVGSVTVNIAMFLEHAKEDWARQLSIYSWLLGEDIGGDFITAIDQLVCSPAKDGGYPSIRVAEHRLRVHPSFQFKQFNDACNLWEIVHSDYIFRHMTKEESLSRCYLLDKQAEAMYGANADPDFIAFTRR